MGGTVIRQRNVAIPQRPESTGPIAAIELDNVAAFARELRAMRAKAELDYPEMAERSHYTMRTLASAAGGLRLPTLPVTVAYVRACGGTEAEISDWEERWQRLAQGRGKDRELPALPASSPDADQASQGTPAPGPAQEPPKTGEIYVITSAKSRDEEW